MGTAASDFLDSLGVRRLDGPPSSVRMRKAGTSRAGAAGAKGAKRRETALVRAIIEALRAIGVAAWRQNSGMLWNGKRPVRFGVKGIPDIGGIVPMACSKALSHGATVVACRICRGVGTVGLALGVEVKIGDAKLSPEQEAFLEMIRHAGGLALVARSIDDVIPVVLDRMGQTPTRRAGR